MAAQAQVRSVRCPWTGRCRSASTLRSPPPRRMRSHARARDSAGLCLRRPSPWEAHLVAQYEGRPVGVMTTRLEQRNRRLGIGHRYVDRAVRRRGVAKKLLERAMADGTLRGVRVAWVETQNVNVPAIRACRASGFDRCAWTRRCTRIPGRAARSPSSWRGRSKDADARVPGPAEQASLAVARAPPQSDPRWRARCAVPILGRSGIRRRCAPRRPRIGGRADSCRRGAPGRTTRPGRTGSWSLSTAAGRAVCARATCRGSLAEGDGAVVGPARPLPRPARAGKRGFVPRPAGAGRRCARRNRPAPARRGTNAADRPDHKGRESGTQLRPGAFRRRRPVADSGEARWDWGRTGAGCRAPPVRAGVAARVETGRTNVRSVRTWPSLAIALRAGVPTKGGAGVCGRGFAWKDGPRQERT